MLQTKNVFLYIPNIIGYFRYLFMFLTFFTYRDHPLITVLLATSSQVLDAFDGMAARKFNQCTNFGAVLDMVCDRASDACLLAYLGSFYPQYAFIFYGDILLDLTSHWYQMYAALSSGEHHKKSPSRFTLLNIYYNNKTVLFTLCAGNGLFMGVCYVMHFEKELGFTPAMVSIMRVLLLITGTLFAIKKFMSIIQLISASEKIVAMETANKEK